MDAIALVDISQHSNQQSIAALTLVNAATDQDIRTLTDNDTIDIATTPNINIRANTDPAMVGSVGFDLNGTLTTDDSAPYTITAPATLGSYTLTVTPYTESGTAGTPFTLTFTVVDGST